MYKILTSSVFFPNKSDKEDDLDEQGLDADAETAQEKRLRLAKQYLAQLENEGTVEIYFSIPLV